MILPGNRAQISKRVYLESLSTFTCISFFHESRNGQFLKMGPNFPTTQLCGTEMSYREFLRTEGTECRINLLEQPQLGEVEVPKLHTAAKGALLQSFKADGNSYSDSC